MGFSGGEWTGLALGGLPGLSVAQGQQAAREQKRALTRQEEAQRQALRAAASQQRRSEMEFRRVNRKVPDVGSLLAGEAASSRQGPGSTMLTGFPGIDPQRLLLGRTSLLGG